MTRITQDKVLTFGRSVFGNGAAPKALFRTGSDSLIPAYAHINPWIHTLLYLDAF